MGAGIAALVLAGFGGAVGYRLQSLVPLALAGVAATLWLVSFGQPRWNGPAGLAIAACLAWSAVIHLSTDLPASRRARNFNLARLTMVENGLAILDEVFQVVLRENWWR